MVNSTPGVQQKGSSFCQNFSYASRQFLTHKDPKSFAIECQVWNLFFVFSLLNSVPGVRTLDLGSHLAGLGGGGQALGPTCKGKKDKKVGFLGACYLAYMSLFALVI